MKITCECGAMIHDHSDRMAHKAHVIPDQVLNALCEAIDKAIEQPAGTAAGREEACMKVRTMLSEVTRAAWQCGKCGRLYLDDHGYRTKCFVPAAPDESRDIFRAPEQVG